MEIDKSSPAAGVVIPQTSDSIAFVKGLVERGEAVRPRPDGSLPANATHEIVGTTDAGHPIVKRVRFRIA